MSGKATNHNNKEVDSDISDQGGLGKNVSSSGQLERRRREKNLIERSKATTARERRRLFTRMSQYTMSLLLFHYTLLRDIFNVGFLGFAAMKIESLVDVRSC